MPIMDYIKSAADPIGNPIRNAYGMLSEAVTPGAPRRDRDPNAERAGFQQYIGYDKLSAEDREFADQWLGGQDFGYWNSGWYDSQSKLFQEQLSRYRNERDINKARDRYEELTDPNSTYNQNMYNRISRMYSPKTNVNEMLAAALGMGGKSSGFLANALYNQADVKAKESTYNAFQSSYERAESQAQGYLDLATGREQSLLKIMSDQRLTERQMEEARKQAEREERMSLFNTLLKGGIAVGMNAILPGSGALVPATTFIAGGGYGDAYGSGGYDI